MKIKTLINPKNFQATCFFILICNLLSSCSQNVIAKELDFTKLEIAETAQQVQIGLMNRKSLCPDCGMLFILPNTTQLPFWMKNTYIPLDMIFISEEGYIVTIHENTEPLNETKMYWPKQPVKYVLEVNAGYSKKHQLKENQYIDIKNLLEQSVRSQF